MTTINEIAENIVRNEVLACQSALVDSLIQQSAEGFQIEDIENLYIDPWEFTLEECREALRDHGYDCPDPNPWNMIAQTCVELLLDTGHDANESEPIEDLRAAVVEAIDGKEIDGLDDWRETVRDEIPPREPLEWWLVTQTLAGNLRELGEPLIDNDYGYWWGRTCSGQAISSDGTMQRVAQLIEDRCAQA